MTDIIVNAAFGRSVRDAPASIVFLPEGRHTISASVNGEGKTIDVEVDASLAEKFQADLADRLAGKVRPNLDFDHKGGKASAIPTAFRYEEGRGLMMDVDWTNAGREAIDGRDYSYFSPSFTISDGKPTGLPKGGAIGALVNDPAFEDIERIAAAKTTTPPAPTKTMDTTTLVEAGVLSEAEAPKDGAIVLAQTRVQQWRETETTVEALKTENETLKARVAEADQAKALSVIEAAVQAGRIPAKDEATKAFWLRQLTADHADAFAEASKAIEAIPGNSGLVVPVAGTAALKTDHANGSSGIEAEAQALVDAGKAPTLSEAYRAVFNNQPEKYEAYRLSNINGGRPTSNS